jgi:hypothetical protein
MKKVGTAKDLLCPRCKHKKPCDEDPDVCADDTNLRINWNLAENLSNKYFKR